MERRARSRAVLDNLQSYQCEIEATWASEFICYPARLTRNLPDTLFSSSKDEQSVKSRGHGSRHPASCR